MPQAVQLTPDLWVMQSAMYSMNSGIWLRKGVACLIDPGVLPAEIEHIAAFLESHAAIPQFLILTHGHWDHVLGARRFPGVPIMAHASYAEEMAKRRTGIQRYLATWGRDQHIITADAPFEPPQPTHVVTEEMSLNVGDLVIRAIHTPGHAPDHLALYQPEAATLWAGDMLSDREIPYISDAFAAYERTLTTIATYEIRALIPGHGQPTTHPAEIQRRIATDRHYLANLRTSITEAIQQNCALEETVARCTGLPIPYSGEEQSHQRNVESVYAELGGMASPNQVGWEQAWNSMQEGV